MARLRIALVSAVLAAGLAVAGPVHADQASDDLPWWAVGDYPAAEAPHPAPPATATPDPGDATAQPAEAPAPAAPAWWAGGPDAVVVLAGSDAKTQAVRNEPSEGTNSGGATPVAGSQAAGAPEDVAAADVTSAPEGDDGGRNPLFHRAEGHRAGEDPAGSSSAADDSAASDPAATDPAAKDPVPPLVEQPRRRGSNECRRLPRQIAHYQQQLDAAGSGASDMARSSLESEIARLEARLQRRCPQPQGPSKLQKTVQLLAKAAKVAAKVASYMYGSPF